MSGKRLSLFGLVGFGNLMYNFKITKPNFTKPNQNEVKLIPDIENMISGNFYPKSFLISGSQLTKLPNQAIPNKTK